MATADLLCPACGQPAIGTSELLPAVALFDRSTVSTDNPPYPWPYLGVTEYNWYDLYTVHDTEGRPILVCQDGHTWAFELENESERS